LELFRDRGDYLHFISVLQYALLTSGCALWGFTLMLNHYHLVLYGSSVELTACMRRLNSMYSTYHNRKYGLEGHAFDGPYQAYRQGSLFLLLRCIAYVFLNPVAAGKAAKPEDYPWTSYRSFVGMIGSPMETPIANLMGQVDQDPRKAWTLFYRAMEREVIRSKAKPVHGLSMVEVHSQQFEWLLEYAQELAPRLGGEDPKLVAMYWARQCGIWPRAISLVLKDTSPYQVSQAVRGLKTRLSKDPELAQRLRLP
jgi:hypothetical protein